MLALLLCVLCLWVNAFFVAAEFALVKAQLPMIAELARKGDKRAVRGKAVLERLDRYLSVTQLGITVASLGLGWIGEPALERLANHVVAALGGGVLGPVGHAVVDVAGLGVLTYLHLLLGELVPKFVALKHPQGILLFSAVPLRAVNLALHPVLWFLEKSQRAVLHALHVDPNVTSERVSEEELLGRT